MDLSEHSIVASGRRRSAYKLQTGGIIGVYQRDLAECCVAYILDDDLELQHVTKSRHRDQVYQAFAQHDPRIGGGSLDLLTVLVVDRHSRRINAFR